MTNHTESGWPVLKPDSPLLRRVNIPDGKGSPTVLTLHWGSPAFLLAHFAVGFDKTVEDLNGPVLDDWAYAYRPVRGYSTVWSDHAGGVAMDLNSTAHPLGERGTFTDAEHDQIERLLQRYDGALYWGGNYHHRADEMHVGCADVPYSKLEKVARHLLDTHRGRIVCEANPGLRAYVLS